MPNLIKTGSTAKQIMPWTTLQAKKLLKIRSFMLRHVRQKLYASPCATEDIAVILISVSKSL